MANGWKDTSKENALAKQLEEDFGPYVLTLMRGMTIEAGMAMVAEACFYDLQNTHPILLNQLEASCVRGITQGELHVWIHSYPNQYVRNRLSYAVHHIISQPCKEFDGE